MSSDLQPSAESATPRGDKPRKIVVCHPDDYAAIQRGVTKDLGHSDVLVQPSRLVEPGTSYVMDASYLDPPPFIANLPRFDG